jgi:hypothetical protein
MQKPEIKNEPQRHKGHKEKKLCAFAVKKRRKNLHCKQKKQYLCQCKEMFIEILTSRIFPARTYMKSPEHIRSGQNI